MDYENVGKTIMNMDPAVRFVTIFDTNDQKPIYSEHKPGVTNLLSKEESQESLQLALNAWKTRSKLEPKIGKGKYVLAEYEKRSEEHSLNSSHGYISYAVFCLK